MKNSDEGRRMDCKHTNVITQETYHKIPQGWEKLMQEREIDMEDYRMNHFRTVHVCQDCGKILEEW